MQHGTMLRLDKPAFESNMKPNTNVIRSPHNFLVDDFECK